MKPWRPLLVIAALAGVAWACLDLRARRRTADLFQSAEDACRQLDFATASAHLSAYLELRPAQAQAHLLAARCSRREEFLEYFNGPRPELPRRAAQHLAAARRLGAAPEAVALEQALGRIQRGELTEDDRALLARAEGDGPDAPLILEATIHGLLRQWQFEKALACVEQLLRHDPKNALALFWRGRIGAEFHRQRSNEDFASAVRLNPQFAAARFYLAESLLRANQVAQAETHLRILNEQVPDNLLVRLAWARCRIAQGDDAQGRQLLDSWLADAPKNHPRLLEALTARAQLALSAGASVEAETFARRALREAPLDRYAIYTLACCLHAQGRVTEARAAEESLDQIKKDLRNVAQCREQLARAPADVHLRHEIGTAYLRLGRPGNALVWLYSVLDRDPAYRPTLEALVEYHTRAGDEALADALRRRLSGAPPHQPVSASAHGKGGPSYR
jgi:thioredoxin-like negative regulator of GroEL